MGTQFRFSNKCYPFIHICFSTRVPTDKGGQKFQRCSFVGNGFNIDVGTIRDLIYSGLIANTYLGGAEFQIFFNTTFVSCVFAILHEEFGRRKTSCFPERIRE